MFSHNLTDLTFLLFSGSSHSRRPPSPSWWRVDQSDHCPAGRRNALCGSGRPGRILQHGQEEEISARYLQSSEARGDGSQAGAKLPAQASSWGETYLTVIASLPFLQMWSPDIHILHTYRALSILDIINMSKCLYYAWLFMHFKVLYEADS